MICPCCKQPKAHDDFYWRKAYPHLKLYNDCKTCVVERVKEKNRNKAIHKQDFLYQYFN